MSNIFERPNFHSLASQGLSMPEQGTQEWLDGRKGRITGSKPSSLFFDFKQPSDWDAILDKWFGDSVEDFDQLARDRMQWGSTHEDTAVGVIMDHFPTAHFYECAQININDVYAVSPDGAMIVFNEDGTEQEHFNVEIKCPGRYGKGGVQTPQQMAEYLEKKWQAPAYYYMTQVHQEMAGQNAAQTLFVAWTPTRTRMWRIPFDKPYWELCLEVFENFRKKDVPFDVMYSKVKKLARRSRGVAYACQDSMVEIHHDSAI